MLRKCIVKTLFFGRHEGKLETFAKKISCVAASLETLCEDLIVRVREKQAAWKLLSEISRTALGTAPGCRSANVLRASTIYGNSQWSS